jgi:hypothetical protein
VPVARDADGKSLPRAYVVARRRSSPRGISVALPPDDGATTSPETTVPAERAAESQPAKHTTPLLPAPVAVPVTTKVEVRAPVKVSEPAATTGAATQGAAATSTPTPTSTPYTPDVDSPKSPQDQERSDAATPRAAQDAASFRETPETSARRPRLSDSRAAASGTWTMSRKQLIVFLFAIAIVAISVSTIVAIIVGRSVTDSVITR